MIKKLKIYLRGRETCQKTTLVNKLIPECEESGALWPHSKFKLKPIKLARDSANNISQPTLKENKRKLSSSSSEDFHYKSMNINLQQNSKECDINIRNSVPMNLNNLKSPSNIDRYLINDMKSNDNESVSENDEDFKLSATPNSTAIPIDIINKTQYNFDLNYHKKPKCSILFQSSFRKSPIKDKFAKFGSIMKIRQTKINKLDENESKYNIQLPVLANINRRSVEPQNNNNLLDKYDSMDNLIKDKSQIILKLLKKYIHKLECLKQEKKVSKLVKIKKTEIFGATIDEVNTFNHAVKDFVKNQHHFKNSHNHKYMKKIEIAKQMISKLKENKFVHEDLKSLSSLGSNSLVCIYTKLLNEYFQEKSSIHKTRINTEIHMIESKFEYKMSNSKIIPPIKPHQKSRQRNNIAFNIKFSIEKYGNKNREKSKLQSTKRKHMLKSVLKNIG